MRGKVADWSAKIQDTASNEHVQSNDIENHEPCRAYPGFERPHPGYMASRKRPKRSGVFCARFGSKPPTRFLAGTVFGDSRDERSKRPVGRGIAGCSGFKISPEKALKSATAHWASFRGEGMQLNSSGIIPRHEKSSLIQARRTTKKRCHPQG